MEEVELFVTKVEDDLKADEISIFLQSVKNVKHMICSLGSSGCNTLVPSLT